MKTTRVPFMYEEDTHGKIAAKINVAQILFPSKIINLPSILTIIIKQKNIKTTIATEKVLPSSKIIMNITMKRRSLHKGMRNISMIMVIFSHQ